MSDAREQFRDRIHLIFDESLEQSDRIRGRLERSVSKRDALEAVYTEALRDVIGDLDQRYIVIGIEEADGNVRTAIDAIEQVAADRGIDLEVK